MLTSDCCSALDAILSHKVGTPDQTVVNAIPQSNASAPTISSGSRMRTRSGPEDHKDARGHQASADGESKPHGPFDPPLLRLGSAARPEQPSA
jgi:hypothetical protein